MKAALWVAMMTVWLAGLAFGAWWVWPHFERMALTSELVFSGMWLVIGGAAWVLCLNLGIQRFFRR
jgi:hypothetical protein